MTVAQALRAATSRLSGTSDTARLDAELLMAHTLDVTRSDLLLRHLRDPAPATFAALIERRAAHEPVAYITGTAEFYGRALRVGPGVLIPRPDTETLIEVALERAGEQGRALDLGTGSGALLLTLLAERERWEGIGIDAAPAALTLAQANAAALGLDRRAAFRLRDWRAPGWAEGLGPVDLIVCNPPYVETTAALDRQVRDYEPAAALFAGEDGLDDYRILIPKTRKLLIPGGLALFEIGHAQGEAVAGLARAEGFQPEIRNDLANRQRCVILR